MRRQILENPCAEERETLPARLCCYANGVTQFARRFRKPRRLKRVRRPKQRAATLQLRRGPRARAQILVLQIVQDRPPALAAL